MLFVINRIFLKITILITSTQFTDSKKINQLK